MSAPLLQVEALDLESMPRPLVSVLDHVTGEAQ